MKASITTISQHVCDFFEIGLSDLKSRSRKETIVDGRQAITLLAIRYGYTPKEVGLYINRKRTSVLHHINDRPAPQSVTACMSVFKEEKNPNKGMAPFVRKTDNRRQFRGKYERNERFNRLDSRPRVTVINNIR